MRALRTATSGMLAQQLNVEVISNNIANMNTVGFKRQRAEFQDLLYQNVERMGAQSSTQGTVATDRLVLATGAPILDRGGHFAAFEQPELFVDEVRAAFRTLR